MYIRKSTSHLKLKTISDSDVKSLLKKSTGKVCELDRFPRRLNRTMESSLIPLCMYIMKKWLSEDYFAYLLKIALVKPLRKKHGMDLVKRNYRPVSNLSASSKMVEAKAK